MLGNRCSQALKLVLVFIGFIFHISNYFYGPGCKPRPVLERCRTPPSSPLHTMTPPCGTRALGSAGFVVKILTLEHEDNYV